MKLTAEQTEDLPFPIGCPVWYNFSETASDEGALKQGVVESVSFNYSTKDLLYEVVYKDGDADKKGNIVEEVSEHKLAYGANCPVTVTIDCNEDGSAVEEGSILLSEPSSSDPSKILYTVMICMEESQARYEDGIDANRIRYRKIKADTKVAVATKTDALAAGSSVPKDQPSEIKITDPHTANISGMALSVHPVTRKQCLRQLHVIRFQKIAIRIVERKGRPVAANVRMCQTLLLSLPRQRRICEQTQRRPAIIPSANKTVVDKSTAVAMIVSVAPITIRVWR